MWYFVLLTWFATGLQFCFASLSIASGLYYLAELVEEYASVAGKIIRIIVWGIFGIYIGFLLFEDLPFSMIFFGILSQVSYLSLLRNFPCFLITSGSAICSIGFAILNHYLAFSYFTNHYHPFMEVMAYFTVCLWIVPFALFISLSANDYVLPTQAESRSLLGDQLDESNDVVSNYFGKKKRNGLLNLFKSTKELVLPQRTKNKGF